MTMGRNHTSIMSPQERYAMISELAYTIGEERRRCGIDTDMARDWLEAETKIDNFLCHEPGQLPN